MKKYLTAPAALLLIAFSLSGCFWHHGFHGGYGGGYHGGGYGHGGYGHGGYH